MTMKFLNITLSGFQIISFLFVIGYLLGILNNYFSDKNNYCAMTYMFEYPQSVRIYLDENKLYPQYGLYAYSEGRFTERARKMWFDGIPVLFLPGNSGSHMQVRSIASVALRKALSQEYDYHFDFFTINYNEELSGLYGGTLQGQTQFASACITKVLSLYKNNRYTKSVPTSVIIIGHSMGGIIAKRLLAYPSTINVTNVALTLAAPLEAPVVNFDSALNDYYMLMKLEWDAYINRREDVRDKKFLISIGSGPRDVLVPAGLTSSNDSRISALATSIPGVWVSPDHVSMVWCKQLVMVINRFLFDIVDPQTKQLTDSSFHIMTKARQHFQSNRSMFLNPHIIRNNVTMQQNAFWYEDNRRIYQISRPEIDRTTYLMIRLVSFPQNRFVAIEAVNVQNKDWIFGCNVNQVHNNMYRYCKEATSLSELSRWSGSAESARRKLATVQLHALLEHTDWTHVVVRVPPTDKPMTLNVDINDHASRVLLVQLPAALSLGASTVRARTEPGSLYYELALAGWGAAQEAYLLYVEPTPSCLEPYHVSAELHVPWAENHNYYHYFTHLKRSPMKLRLFKSNPNLTLGLEQTEKVKITLLLDPKCTFSISISTSWYHRVAQLSRTYSPVLVPYAAALVLLAARSSVLGLRERGVCPSFHGALAGEGVKPYYALVFARLGTVIFMSIPSLSFLFENASWNNLELQYFSRSLLVLPAYLTALGILNVCAAGALAAMVFSSQLAHRLFLRLVWRGGRGLGERLATGLQRAPLVVSAALVCAAPLSCGAASLAAGAAFYAFMISKMYEEYLEDYVYKLISKIASKICYKFKAKKNKAQKPESEQDTDSPSGSATGYTEINSTDDNNKENIDNTITNRASESSTHLKVQPPVSDKVDDETIEKDDEKSKCDVEKNSHIDEDLNNINFHLMLFFMWMVVTILNIPALLTWARNFKYSMVLKPDTSYHTGFVMSACSAIIWQMNGPRKNLKNYEAVAALLFTMAVFILALGPFSLSIVNYGVTFMFVIITIQQLYDIEDSVVETTPKEPVLDNNIVTSVKAPLNDDGKDVDIDKLNEDATSEDKKRKESSGSNDNSEVNNEGSSECDVCNENRIYNIFKNLKEKLSFSDNL